MVHPTTLHKRVIFEGEKVFLGPADNDEIGPVRTYYGYSGRFGLKKTDFFAKIVLGNKNYDLFRKNLRYENEILSLFNDERVVKNYGIFPVLWHGDMETKQIALLMKRVNGMCLEGHFNSRKFISSFPEFERLSMIYQIADILHFVQKPDGKRPAVQLQDFKPGNLILNSEGIIKLCDLEHVVKLTHEQYETDEMIYAPIGTIKYLTPERSLFKDKERNEPAMNSKSNIFTLGLIAYEIITGNHLLSKKGVPGLEAIEFGVSALTNTFRYFDQTKNIELINNHLNQTMPKTIPGFLDLIIASLDYHPEKRPSTNDYLSVLADYSPRTRLNS